MIISEETLIKHQVFLKLDLQIAYHSILPMSGKLPSIYPTLPVNYLTSEDEKPLSEHLWLTPEERIYGAIPGSQQP